MSNQFVCNISDIHYDTDGEIVFNLEDSMNLYLTIDEDISQLSDSEIESILSDKASDEISNLSGYCHFGFNMTYTKL